MHWHLTEESSLIIEKYITGIESRIATIQIMAAAR